MPAFEGPAARPGPGGLVLVPAAAASRDAAGRLPVTIPFQRVHVRGDDCATTTLLKCDEQPNCQRAEQAAAMRLAGPLGARPIRTGVARTGHWPGGGAASGCRAPHPAGAGRFLRRVRPAGSSLRTGRSGRCLDRSLRLGPPGGASVGPPRVGDGADVASRSRRTAGQGAGPGLATRSRGIILRKEVIQPQVPLRLPCYDLVPITGFTFGACR